MAQNFGIEAPRPHEHRDTRESARFLVLIESGGTALARLFLQDRTQVAEFDGGAEEVAMMTRDLLSTATATDAAWDRALAGHSREEREAAEVFTLAV